MEDEITEYLSTNFKKLVNYTCGMWITIKIFLEMWIIAKK